MRRIRTAGFTLVELMVTIAIVAILAAIAFPNFEYTLRSNRVATTTNELIGSLALARSEAIRNPTGAAICPSANGTSCDASGAWGDGWAVWIDLNGNGAIDGTERVVRYVQARNRILVGGTSAPIRFDNRGRQAGGAREFTVQPSECASGTDLKRVLTVSATGQARVARTTCTT
ncbi:GspH/FimT family pseudopilin [Stenotrophomonas sp. Marseille-Q4652]|uniref:GspH/FimT family pseudopilin n=1 Tax=Stenotrophomonas sp. Marseille-Q4652 TaxID=2866595 RepID=UPI001CE49365|nr:GspH/FimT family pseudopilin [Stenotrophomonas sp. Marseille-Q4652]